MKHLMILVPLMLSACNTQPKTTVAKASASDVEARIAAALNLQPGNWATNFRITAMEMTGTKDPKAAEAIQQAMAAHGADATAFENCISAAIAKNPGEILFAGIDMSGCTYDSFTAAGGRMNAKMTCRRGKGKLIRTMTGTYSPTAYAFSTEMIGDGVSEATALSMKTQSNAKRLGACPVDLKNTV